MPHRNPGKSMITIQCEKNTICLYLYVRDDLISKRRIPISLFDCGRHRCCSSWSSSKNLYLTRTSCTSFCACTDSRGGSASSEVAMYLENSSADDCCRSYISLLASGGSSTTDDDDDGLLPGSAESLAYDGP